MSFSLSSPFRFNFFFLQPHKEQRAYSLKAISRHCIAYTPGTMFRPSLTHFLAQLSFGLITEMIPSHCLEVFASTVSCMPLTMVLGQLGHPRS